MKATTLCHAGSRTRIFAPSLFAPASFAPFATQDLPRAIQAMRLSARLPFVFAVFAVFDVFAVVVLIVIVLVFVIVVAVSVLFSVLP